MIKLHYRIKFRVFGMDWRKPMEDTVDVTEALKGFFPQLLTSFEVQPGGVVLYNNHGVLIDLQS